MRWNQLFRGASLTVLGVIACAQSATIAHVLRANGREAETKELRSDSALVISPGEAADSSQQWQ